MGTLFKRGKKWGINYIDPNGRQVRKLISPYKEAAVKVLKKLETEIVEGKYLDIAKSHNILFEDFAQQYIDTYVRLENKNFTKQSCLVRNLVKYFKGHALDRIDTCMIRQYLAKRLEKVKPSTVNRYHSLLQSMFNRAIEWDIFLGRNPTMGIKKLPENNQRCRWLTEKEQERLLSHCHEMTRPIVLIALQSGMRWGEIINLKWGQSLNSNYVDFENNLIYVHESMSKNKRSRHIPLSQDIRLELENMFTKKSGYIFLNFDTKKPLGSIKRSFNTALRRAGIANFKFHDLRHTFASQLVSRGTDLYVVQKLLGHTTPKMTQRYAHLKSDQLIEAIEKISLQNKDVGYNTLFNNDSTEIARI